MHHRLTKTGVVAGACALAFFAAPSPAKAVSLVTLDKTGTIVVPAVDQEDLSVEEDLRPDEPPEALEGTPREQPEMAPMEPSTKEGESSGNIEDEMIDKIGPGAE